MHHRISKYCKYESKSVDNLDDRLQSLLPNNISIEVDYK